MLSAIGVAASLRGSFCYLRKYALFFDLVALSCVMSIVFCDMPLAAVDFLVDLEPRGSPSLMMALAFAKLYFAACLC